MMKKTIEQRIDLRWTSQLVVDEKIKIHQIQHNEGCYGFRLVDYQKARLVTEDPHSSGGAYDDGE